MRRIRFGRGRARSGLGWRLGLVVLAWLAGPGGVGAQQLGWSFLVQDPVLRFTAVRTDGQGRAFVLGSVAPGPGSQLTLRTGGTVPLRWGNFVAALDTAGLAYWVAPLPLTSDTLPSGRIQYNFFSPFDLATDGRGSVWVCGIFNGRPSLDGLPVRAFGIRQGDGLVAKIDSTGQWEWARRFGSATDDGIPFSPYPEPAFEYAVNLAVDSVGNCALLGRTVSSVILDSTAQDSIRFAPTADLFASWTTTGVLRWRRNIGPLGGYPGNVLESSPAGGWYISSYVGRAITVEGTPLVPGPAIWAFTPSGRFRWAWQPRATALPGRQPYLQIQGLVVTGGGQVVLNGGYDDATWALDSTHHLPAASGEGYGFVAVLDSGGRVRWADRQVVQPQGSGAIVGFSANALAVTAGGAVLTGGAYRGRPAFTGLPTAPVSSRTNENAVVLGYDPLGTAVAGSWLADSQRVEDAIFLALAADPGGESGFAIGQKGGALLLDGHWVGTVAPPGEWFLARWRAPHRLTAVAPEQEPTATIPVWPNPSPDGRYALRLARAGRVEVLDAVGRVVWRGELGAGVSEVDLRGQPAGVYGLRVSGLRPQLIIKNE